MKMAQESTIMLPKPADADDCRASAVGVEKAVRPTPEAYRCRGPRPLSHIQRIYELCGPQRSETMRGRRLNTAPAAPCSASSARQRAHAEQAGETVRNKTSKPGTIHSGMRCCPLASVLRGALAGLPHTRAAARSRSASSVPYGRQPPTAAHQVARKARAIAPTT